MIEFDFHPVYNPRGITAEPIPGVLFPNGAVALQVADGSIETYKNFAACYETRGKDTKRFVRWLDFDTYAWSHLTALFLALAPYPCSFRCVPTEERREDHCLLGVTFTQTVGSFPPREIEFYVCLSPNCLSDGGYVEEPLEVDTHTFSTPVQTVAFVVEYVKRGISLP